MQTTLLGIGIAVILALAAALAAPYFVDWDAYRTVFEREASRAVGTPLRITGAIDARILPSPSVTLRGVETADPAAGKQLKAREIGIELALGPLVRGEWRATEVRLLGPEVALGLDGAGRLDWAAASLPFDPDALSIERLAIVDARAVLSDAGSASQIVLENLWFNGELRSLAGPIKGEGGFVSNDERHGYRLSVGRTGEGGSARLRLAVDSFARPISAEVEGILRFEQASPRFEGTLALGRLPGVVLAQGRAVANEPWRATARMKIAAANALFEQVELQYGAEERALKLSGTADLRFGKRPRLEGVLSARQLDLDRLLALPETTRRLPLAAVRALADAFGETAQLPIPVRLGIGVDAATLAGAPLQSLRGDFTVDNGQWDVEKVEFRAPGLTQVRASGRLSWSAQGASFAGPAAVDASEPKALVAWLEGRAEPSPGAVGALRATGDVTLGAGRIAIERLAAELDGKPVAGRLVYVQSDAGRPSRLEAALNAAELDVDGTLGFIRNAAPGVSWDLPGELALSVDVGRATVAGIVVKGAAAKLRVDADGFTIERLAVADVAGAAIDAKGRIENPWTAPKGSLAADLEGRTLDGIAALVDRFWPQAAAPVRALAPRMSPAKLHASLDLDRPAATAGAHSARAKIRLDGRTGPARLTLNADASGDGTLAAADIRVDARLDAEDGAALAQLLGLDRAIALGKGAGSLRLTANGPLGGELRVDGRFLAAGADIVAAGAMRVSGDERLTANGDIVATAADVRPLRHALGRPTQPVPASFKARFALSKDEMTFDDLSGRIAATAVTGKLGLKFEQPLRISGRLDADAFDGAALVGALAGIPPAPGRAGATAAAWPSEPFGAPLADLTGQIELRAARAALTPSLELRQLQALIRFAPGETAIEDVQGVLAGGQLLGGLTLQSGIEGLAATVRIAVTGADIQGVLPSAARPPVSGRFSAQLEARGSGRSAATLIGSLAGAGTASFESMQIAGLDPQVFDAVIRATDQGLAAEPARIKAIVEPALNKDSLRIARADAALSIAAGQLRLGSMIARGERADLGLSGSVDLAQGLLEGRLALVGVAKPGDPVAGRPEIYLGLKGPVFAPARTLDVSALVGWLTLRSVELQAKRLEALEAERAAAAVAEKRALAAEAERKAALEAERRAAAEAAARAAALPARSDPSVGRTETPDIAVPPRPAPAAPASAPRTHTVPSAPQVAPEASHPPPAAAVPRRVQPAQPAQPAQPVRPVLPPPAAEPAPALPPPIDIRPAPGPRRTSAARPEQRLQEQPRPPAEVPPARRSLLDSLFGQR